jgi:hypothetical protein
MNRWSAWLMYANATASLERAFSKVCGSSKGGLQRRGRTLQALWGGSQGKNAFKSTKNAFSDRRIRVHIICRVPPTSPSVINWRSRPMSGDPHWWPLVGVTAAVGVTELSAWLLVGRVAKMIRVCEPQKSVRIEILTLNSSCGEIIYVICPAELKSGCRYQFSSMSSYIRVHMIHVLVGF